MTNCQIQRKLSGFTDDLFTVEEYKGILSARFKKGLLLLGLVLMAIFIVFFIANAKGQTL
jgi:hypothetical protein